MNLDAIGRAMLLLGAAIAVLGGLLLLASQVPWLGRLPGDISVERGNFRFYAPLATSVLISLLLTVVLNLIARR